MRRLTIVCTLTVLVMLQAWTVGCEQLRRGGAMLPVEEGSDLMEEGQYEQAIEEFSKAIEIDPESFSAYCLRAEAYYEIEQYDKAVADYTKAIEVYPESGWKHPKYANAHYDRGNVYYYMEEYDKAIADYTKAIEIDPGLVDAYYDRGLSYKAQGDIGKAIADFEEVISESDDSELVDKAKQQIAELSE